MPTFGRDTIRKFHSNASAMKKLAARDFEDLLQVEIHFYFSDYFSCLTELYSALFLSSRDCYQSAIIKFYSTFFSSLLLGMV